MNHTWVTNDDCDHVFSVFENFLTSHFEEEHKNRRFRQTNDTNLSQCPCFVSEDILDLPELLVECGGASFGRHVCLLIVHFVVPIDEETVG